ELLTISNAVEVAIRSARCTQVLTEHLFGVVELLAKLLCFCGVTDTGHAAHHHGHGDTDHNCGQQARHHQFDEGECSFCCARTSQGRGGGHHTRCIGASPLKLDHFRNPIVTLPLQQFLNVPIQANCDPDQEARSNQVTTAKCRCAPHAATPAPTNP